MNRFIPFAIIFTIVYFSIVMFAFALKSRKKQPESNEPVLTDRDIERLDYIKAKVKEYTAVKALEIEEDLDKTPTIFDSKFGGLPYWPNNEEYPTDENGEPFIMIAQINLRDIYFDNSLPKEGILQFFVTNDDLYGLGRTDLVRYHKTIDYSVTEEDLELRGIYSNEDCEDAKDLPFDYEAGIRFNTVTSYVSPNCYDYDSVVRNILEKDLHEEVAETRIYLHFNSPEYNYLVEDGYDSNFAHRMFGHPDFTQGDVREGETDRKLLLFQMNSEQGIMWGDSGIANYFISEKDLEEENFSNVLFNWDCY